MRLAWIQFVDGPDGPGVDNTLPPGFSGRPDNSLPGIPAYPSQGLPGGGHISLLPVFPFDPTVGIDNTLPGAPSVDNSLPRPGKKYVVKWLCGSGMILVPDNTLPGSGTAEPK